MGLFGMFESFDEKAKKALEEVRGLGLGVEDLDLSIDGKVVTLYGTATDRESKARAMVELSNRLGDADNVINRIRVEEPAPAAPAAVEAEPSSAPQAGEAPATEVYEVQPGDTLGAIAQRFYGKASLYPKIFEANRDILDDPNLIKVGQKLKIPKLD